MTGFQLQRLGQMMEPGPGNPLEVEGVTNLEVPDVPPPAGAPGSPEPTRAGGASS
jgi:hypothetical protein